jgi:predicted DNA-binding protein with PD1-like motif
MPPHQTKLKRTFIGHLPPDADLYESLTRIVQEEDIKLGRVLAIGATTHAVIAFYDHAQKKYLNLEFPGSMEILTCNGNVSLRDGKPFVHIHILLGDRQGKAFGGHVMPGTKVFACEVFIDEFEGEELHRSYDDETGLYLWGKRNLLVQS